MTFVKHESLLLIYLFHFLVVLWPVHGGAHESRPAIATVEMKSTGEVAIGLSLNLEAAIAGMGTKHDDTSKSPAEAQYTNLRSLPPPALRAAFDRFAHELIDQVSLTTDRGPIRLMVSAVQIPEVADSALPRYSLVSLKGHARPDTEHLYWRIDAKLGDSVVRFLDAASGKIKEAEFVAGGEISGPLSAGATDHQSWHSAFAEYVRVGFIHIVPNGSDHILFVVGLFLLSVRLRALIGQVTAFTLAHTLTLALSMAGLIRLSSAVVEPLIAVSIIYVSVENIVTERVRPWRFAVVFCFGLLHGLGFAGILQEIGPPPGQFVVSLLAFNIGVELGQLSVIAACFVFLGWMMHRKWYRPRIVIPASVAIGLVAVVWAVERASFI